MRLIEAVFCADKREEVEKALKECEPDHFRFSATEEDDMMVLRAFFTENGAQGLVDSLQDICENDDDWRIIVLPVEATAPKPDVDEDNDEKKGRKKSALREEIYNDVAKGAELSLDFFVLTFASAIVAALGLNADNIAAVIGAMVIAPLLGPILAISLGVALGDMKLLTQAGRNALAGLALGFATAAVALLPPAAAAGLFLGAGDIGYFGRSILLLTVNVVCIMIAAQGVYFYKGVRPRTWFERKSADKALKINIAVLAALLLLLVGIIVFAPVGSMPDVPGSGD